MYVLTLGAIVSSHRKAATHDTEICRLYEEMEQQIINEKDRAILKVKGTLLHTVRSSGSVRFKKKNNNNNTFIKQAHIKLTKSDSKKHI